MTEQNPEKSEQSDDIRLLETGEWEKQLAVNALRQEEEDKARRTELEAKDTIPLCPDAEIPEQKPARDFTASAMPLTQQEVFDALYAKHLAFLKGHADGKKLVLRERNFEKPGKANEWTGIDASGYNLTDADLGGVVLASWKFTNTKLHDVRLDGSSVTFSDFSGADIARGSWIVDGLQNSNFGARRIHGGTIMSAANFPADAKDMPIFSRTEEHRANLGEYVEGREHLPYDRRFEFREHINTITHNADLSSAQALPAPVLLAGFNAGARLNLDQMGLVTAALRAAAKKGGKLNQREQALVTASIAAERARMKERA